ncbi:hypothetical protein A7981_08475 [Methylovorus sp. MM2]|uniref:hypothetical protein n=1 Tax=Methylovorus sp. MM2 TaxID=1848038 RepID=UPI0007E22983|nr:hypothetical protein [Methylovorus sp. MM2]OAM51515.1 hypothetical protein A7981_08475 [Methylovorus sp. MM2]
MLKIRNVNDETKWKDYSRVDYVCNQANVRITAISDDQKRREYALKQIRALGFKCQVIWERKEIQVFNQTVDGKRIFICSIEDERR